MLERRWPPAPGAAGKTPNAPGLAAVVTAADADRAAWSVVGRARIRPPPRRGCPVARSISMPWSHIGSGRMFPSGARCAHSADREAGLLDGRCDPGRTDVEFLRARVEVHASDRRRRVVPRWPRRPSKGSASDPIGEGRPGTTRRTRRRRGPVEADTRSATSHGSRAETERGRSPSSSTSCRSPRTRAGGTLVRAPHERASCTRRRPFRSRGSPGRGPRRSPETLRPTAACAARRGALTTWRLHRH